jgi:hypothetical protein
MTGILGGAKKPVLQKFAAPAPPLPVTDPTAASPPPPSSGNVADVSVVTGAAPYEPASPKNLGIFSGSVGSKMLKIAKGNNKSEKESNEASSDDSDDEGW